METEEFADLYAAQKTHSGPAYRRVMQAVRAGIDQAEWPAGEQVPSENELVEALDLSRMTINRAYRELAAEGVLTRVRGVGTFIADYRTPTSLVEIRNIADEIRSRGHRYRPDVHFVREESVEADAPWLVAEGMTGRVFHSLIVHCENGVPLQLEDRYVAASEAPGYMRQDFTEATPNDYLTRAAPLTRGSHVVEAVLGTAQECRLLRIDRSEPCLLVRRRTWSRGSLISLARLIQPGSRGRLEGEFGQP